ncbi:serine hydrolase domain-containing protein [Psychrobacter sp. DAB_AL62B]|uniref:serine hydrolase domain-containing protein n=1 Tax=Psychrobacter sp. DAB_AL62B TaxID=1028420 RepID=UPI002381810F|nr:serine hydrolase [Psychrobacter sp. DAB_AL62B]MDE4454404.1 class C beta-lactamase-related serine hydrolase [Psychrobacter sp. DAB_AL62B]
MVVLKTLFKWIVVPIVALLIIISLGLVVTGNAYIFRGLQLTYLKGENTANIDDYVDFDNRTIRAKDPITWDKSSNFEQVKLTPTLQNALDTDETVAFAIIKDGKLLYENYWQGYSADSHTNSFSMAKTVTTMLYLKAVEDGYISSIDEPITKWLPEYADNQYAQGCTLSHLSAMTSGYDWTEDYYFPINPTAESYYGHDLVKQMVNRDFVEECGDQFKYSSGDTQMLGIALSRALEPHGYTISSYLEEKFWQPLGMEGDAYWSLDGSESIEKVYCCLNASALDFAKFGQLLLNGGEWQGKQLLSKEHVDFIITPNVEAFAEGQAQVYGHSVWTDMESPIPFYAMLGHLGQRVLVLPEENAIIVRLGKQKGLPTPVEGFHLEPDLGQYVTEVKKLLDKLPREQ